jgi:hypothetical protein
MKSYINQFYKLLFISFACLFFMSAYSQVNAPAMPVIVPPSPTVANLMNFEEVPVDNYTGQPDISIPLYSKQLNSELSLPLFLKYSTMGIRIEQRSGWVGTGWSLDAGGVISRTIRGYADEQVKSGSYDEVIGIFHNADFWNFDNLTIDQKQEFIWNVDGDWDNKYDSQPDLYQFSMLGMSGRFVIVKEGGQFVAKQLDMDQKLKIDFTMDSNKTITGFTITDPNGYKYYFGENSAIETTLSETQVFSLSRGNNATTDISFPKTMPVSNSAWMLTSIKTSNEQELANFQYTTSEEYFSAPVSRTLNDFTAATNAYNEQLQSAYNCQSQFRPVSTSVHTYITTQTKKLNRINFRDQTCITFTHTNEGAHPENEGIYLEKIEIKKKVSGQDVMVRAYDLNYETVSSRLWLKNINGGNRFAYQLEYFEKDELPAADSDMADEWGYNRADFRYDNTYGYNIYDYNAVKRGLLTKIIYPTGGAKEFNWGVNTFSYEGNQLIDNFDSNPLNSTINNFTHAFKSDAEGSFLPGQNITIDHDQYINVQKNLTYTGDNINKFEVVFSKVGSTIDHRISLDALPATIRLAEGQYTVTVKVKWYHTGDVGTSQYLQGYINIMYMVKKTGSNYNNFHLGGGPRIEGITFTDPNSEIPLKVFGYIYQMQSIENPLKTVSSGSVDAKLGMMRKEYLITDKKYLYTNSLQYDVALHSIQYKVKTNESTVQLTRGNYVGYKRVLVKNDISLTGTFPGGYTEYIYTNAIDAPCDPGVFYYPYIEKPNVDYLRGLLKQKTVYDKNNTKLEEIINNYTSVTQVITDSHVITPTACEWTQFYETYESYKLSFVTYPLSCGTFDCFSFNYENCGGTTVVLAPFDMHTTSIYAAKSNLTSTTVKKYFANEVNPVQSTTTYVYNPANYQLKQQVTTYTEGASTIEEKVVYEYSVGGYTSSLFQDPDNIIAINNLASLNIINKPIVIATYRNNELLQRLVNKYKTFGIGKIFLGEVETYKGGQTSTAAEDRIIYNTYNEIGNVTEVYAANNPLARTCYVWGYNGTLPVAEIKNIGDYTSLPSQLITDINTASNTGVESGLLSALATLRAHASVQGSQVITLTHDPIDGVLSVTDPKNDRVTYHYDYLGRLEFVKDKNGNILSSNVYYFRNQ